MADEPTGGTVAAEAPVQDSPTVQPAPASEPAPAAAAPTISAEDFATLSDDELRGKYPQVYDHINRRVDRGISKAQERLKQQYSEMAEDRKIVEQYTALSAEDKLAYRDDPQWGPRIEKALKTTASNGAGNPEREKVAKEIADGLFELFRSEDPDLDLNGMANPVDGVKKVLETWKGKERKALESELDKKLDAKLKEALAHAGINSEQPERLPGSVSGGGHSLSSYLAMSSADREAFRRDHADELDRMTREAMGQR